jgi:hypothetical protein
MAGCIQERFEIRDRTLNISSDREAIKKGAFRARLSLEALFDGVLWLPCACHRRNNLLGRLLENSSEAVRPIFRLQQRFRKQTPF